MAKRAKQLLALALSASMMLAAVGCGSSNGNKESSESSVSKDSQQTGTVVSSTSESETVPVEEDPVYPMDNDVELTIWDANYYKYDETYSSYKESPVHMGLAERTGMDVEWTWPVAGTDVNQAFNLLLANEKLPDIVYKYWDVTQGETLIDDGAIYDLTEYLPKYAPDYWEYINQPRYENLLKSMKTASGKLFCLGTFTETFDFSTYIGPVVRKDWLDECGLDIPVTLEDWDEMLLAFKEKYNIAPLGMRSLQLLEYDTVGSAVGALTGAKPNFVLKDGEIIFANAEPEWKDCMALLNRWYTDGLLDPDSVTMDHAAVRNKALNNQLGVIFCPLSQMRNYLADAEAEETGAEWIPIGYPREAEGVPTSMIQTGNGAWAGLGFAMSTSLSEEELKVALNWVNYFFTEEGIDYFNFGAEGVSYTVDSNGKVAFTAAVTDDVNGINAGLKKYTFAGRSVQLREYAELTNGEIGAQAVNVWTENTEALSHMVPNLALTEDENLIYKNMYQQISTYVREMALKFITGEESLDNYDAYVQNLNEMGLKQVVAIRQAAYERYLAK